MDRAEAKFELWPASEGISWLYFRPEPGRPAFLDLDSLRTLDASLDQLEPAARTGEIQALLIASGTPDHSLDGYDLGELRALDEEGVVAWSHEAQSILRRLEELAIPTVAALRARWSGAAAELALACRFRVAASDSGSQITFSQVEEGFLPAWGGCVRLPRMVGVPVAARLILTGESLDLAEARDVGLLDRTFPERDFEDAVERFAKRRAAGGKPVPSRRARRPIHQRFLDDTSAGRRLIARRIVRRYRAETRTDIAVRVTLGLLLESASLPVERAFAMESAAAGRLATEPATRAALHARNVLERIRPLAGGQTGAFSAAVAGAGQTGSDLAHLLITADIPVRLKDAPETVRAGVSRARQRLGWEVEQGRISRAQARRRAGRLDGVTRFGGFGTLDLLIAAGDDTGVDSASLLQAAEPHVLQSCVLAFHDWGRSPSEVQRELRYPERVLGLVCHFPAERFPLVEIAPGAATSRSVVERTLHVMAQTGLNPVLVSDRTPTPGLRLLGLYCAEACRLLAEGATPFQVDEAMETFGFAVGPFHRIDAIGSGRAHRILGRLSDALGERFRTSALFDGIARGAETFYRYRNGVPVAANPSLPPGLSPGGPSVSAMIQRRILLLLINEMARILETDPDLDAARLDAISLLGLGFPPEKGGIVYYAEQLGPASLVEDLNRIARRAGPRYAPADLLREWAASGGVSLERNPQDQHTTKRGERTSGEPKENGRPEAGQRTSGALT